MLSFEAQEDYRVLCKFFCALALHELINERPKPEVRDRFGIQHDNPLNELQVRPPGGRGRDGCRQTPSTRQRQDPAWGQARRATRRDLPGSLDLTARAQDRAATMARMVAAFCSQMGWHDLELLVTKFCSERRLHRQASHACRRPRRMSQCVMMSRRGGAGAGRVQRGVQADLVALTEIEGIGKYRARVLYRAGVRTPELLVAQDLARIVDIFVDGARGDRIA